MLAVKLSEYPLAAVRALQVKEYFASPYQFVPFLHKRSIYICELPIPSASFRYASFSSARIVPG